MAEPGATEIVTTTLRLRQGVARDSIGNNNAALIKIKEYDGFKSYSGGRTIFEEIMYDDNASFQWFEGGQVLSTAYNTTLTAAEYNHKQAAIAIVMTEFERLINAGPEGKIKFATARAEVAEITMKNKLEASVYSDGTASGGKELGGLALLVAKTPTSGTVGGIDRSVSANAFWRNYTLGVVSTYGAAASSATIKPIYTRALINLTRGADYPTVGLLGDSYYEYLGLAFDTIERATTNKELEKQGVQHMVYKGVPMCLGGGVIFGGETLIGATDSYLLNTKYLKFRYHQDAYMEPMEERQSINQLASVKFLGFMGNMTASNCRLQGRVFDS